MTQLTRRGFLAALGATAAGLVLPEPPCKVADEVIVKMAWDRG